MGSAGYQSSSTDRGLLAATLHDRGAASLPSENFDDPRHAYLDELIPKPWGEEFRAYADDFYDVSNVANLNAAFQAIAGSISNLRISH